MAAISEHLELRAGRLAVDLAPAIGGSIARFRIDGIDVMRPLSDANRATCNVLGVASFPMIRFANRMGGVAAMALKNGTGTNAGARRSGRL